LTQINDALIGNVNYQGLWNASTNTPTLANPPASGTKGYYYIVSTAGTFASISFEVGDWIISNGSAWQKVDNTDAVSSVFGRTGNVVAANGDYTTAQVTESGNLYYTDGRARGALSFAAGSGAYNSSTGVITIPTNNNQITNGAGYITSSALAGYLPLTGGTMTGNITFNGVSGRGLFWGMNTDGALIRFISTGDSAGQSYLEIGTTDNSDEPIIFTQTGLTRVQIATDGLLKNGSSQNYLFENGGTWGINITGNAGTVTNGVYTSRTITINGTTQDLSANRTFSVGTVTSVTASSPLASSGGTTPNITIQQASGSQNGFLSSTDWTTFNGKQNALTNPVTGTGTTNYLPKFTGSTTIGNSQVFDNGTNVGIGTTSFAYGPKMAINSTGQNSLAIQTTDTSQGSSGTILYIGTGATTGNSSYGILRVLGDGGTAAANLVLQITGNLLVGTTTDAGFKLDVNGTGRFSNQITMAYTGTPRLIVQDTGSGDGNVGVLFKENTSNKWTIASVSSAFQIYNEQTQSNALFITSGNNVGIGTNSPESLSNNVSLQIDGTNHSFVRTGTSNYGGYFATIPTAEVLCIANVRNPVTGTYNNTGKAASGINLFSQSSNGYIEFLTTATNNSGPSTRMTITSGGNVLIGATSEIGSGRRELVIRGGNGSLLSLGNNTTADRFQIVSDSGENALLNNKANTPMVFFTNNTQAMRITSNGNLLIGTTDDNGNRLRVNGTIFSDSSVTATSFFESSDATLKTLVQDNYQAKGIDSVVAKLYIKNGKQELGYFAQDLQGILPSAVSKGSDGLLNLSYREVHTAKIAYLEEEIRQIKKRYEIN
jgi:hypothetical protein